VYMVREEAYVHTSRRLLLFGGDQRDFEGFSRFLPCVKMCVRRGRVTFNASQLASESVSTKHINLCKVYNSSALNLKKPWYCKLSCLVRLLLSNIPSHA
jgi:hypothetical protein